MQLTATITVNFTDKDMEPFFNSKYYRELPYELKCQVDLLHSCDVKGA